MTSGTSQLSISLDGFGETGGERNADADADAEIVNGLTDGIGAFVMGRELHPPPRLGVLGAGERLLMTSAT